MMVVWWWWRRSGGGGDMDEEEGEHPEKVERMEKRRIGRRRL